MATGRGLYLDSKACGMAEARIIWCIRVCIIAELVSSGHFIPLQCTILVMRGRRCLKSGSDSECISENVDQRQCIMKWGFGTAQDYAHGSLQVLQLFGNSVDMALPSTCVFDYPTAKSLATFIHGIKVSSLKRLDVQKCRFSRQYYKVHGLQASQRFLHLSCGNTWGRKRLHGLLSWAVTCWNLTICKARNDHSIDSFSSIFSVPTSALHTLFWFDSLYRSRFLSNLGYNLAQDVS